MPCYIIIRKKITLSLHLVSGPLPLVKVESISEIGLESERDSKDILAKPKCPQFKLAPAMSVRAASTWERNCFMAGVTLKEGSQCSFCVTGSCTWSKIIHSHLELTVTVHPALRASCFAALNTPCACTVQWRLLLIMLFPSLSACFNNAYANLKQGSVRQRASVPWKQNSITVVPEGEWFLCT